MAEINHRKKHIKMLFAIMPFECGGIISRK